MDTRIDQLSFEEWILYVFDHSVTEPAWYWDNYDFWDPMAQPRVTVSYLTNLFENLVNTLSAYSDAQINQGLRYLVSNSLSDHMFPLKDKQVPLTERLNGLQSMYKLFETLFLPRCSANLCYLDEKENGTPNPLDSVCYMWWDTLPIHGSTAGPDTPVTADTILSVITRTLTLNSDACRESALHGLGHWHYYDPKRIEHIVDDFLAANPHTRPELLTYARNARNGGVQ